MIRFGRIFYQSERALASPFIKTVEDLQTQYPMLDFNIKHWTWEHHNRHYSGDTIHLSGRSKNQEKLTERLQFDDLVRQWWPAMLLAKWSVKSKAKQLACRLLT